MLLNNTAGEIKNVIGIKSYRKDFCSKDDVNAVIDLIYNSLLALKDGQTFNYLK